MQEEDFKLDGLLADVPQQCEEAEDQACDKENSAAPVTEAEILEKIQSWINLRKSTSRAVHTWEVCAKNRDLS